MRLGARVGGALAREFGGRSTVGNDARRDTTEEECENDDSDGANHHYGCLLWSSFEATSLKNLPKLFYDMMLASVQGIKWFQTEFSTTMSNVS